MPLVVDRDDACSPGGLREGGQGEACLVRGRGYFFAVEGRLQLSLFPDPALPPMTVLVYRRDFDGVPYVTLSWTDPRFRRLGLASYLYETLLLREGRMRSDETVSMAAQRLWQALASSPRVQVRLGVPGDRHSPHEAFLLDAASPQGAA